MVWIWVWSSSCLRFHGLQALKINLTSWGLPRTTLGFFFFIIFKPFFFIFQYLFNSRLGSVFFFSYFLRLWLYHFFYLIGSPHVFLFVILCKVYVLKINFIIELNRIKINKCVLYFVLFDLLFQNFTPATHVTFSYVILQNFAVGFEPS